MGVYNSDIKPVELGSVREQWIGILFPSSDEKDAGQEDPLFLAACGGQLDQIRNVYSAATSARASNNED